VSWLDWFDLVGAVVGIALASATGLGTVACVVVWLVRRRRARRVDLAGEHRTGSCGPR